MPRDRRLTGALALAGVALAGIALLAAVIAAAGVAPGLALRALVTGAAGSPAALANSVALAIPLLFTGLAVTVAFRGGVWNIGGEGQFLVGMLAAVAVGLALPRWPAVVLVPLALLAGAAAGSLWAAPPAALRFGRGVPEVISTIMLNFVAAYLLSYCVQGPLHEAHTDIPRSPRLRENAWLAVILPQSDVHGGLVLGLLAGVAVFLLLSRTAFGLELRAVGLGPAAAQAAGIPVNRVGVLTFLLSGALAGLGGAAHGLGVARQLFIYEPGDPGYGYTGVAAALLGGQTAVGTVGAALLFGALAAGSNTMQREAGVSFQLAYVVQAILIFALLLRGGKRA